MDMYRDLNKVDLYIGIKYGFGIKIVFILKTV